MNARFEVIVGPEKGRSFPLEEVRSMVVGRGRACHVRLHDARVSRTHLLVEKVPLGYRLSDMGSSAGTFVNGQRVQQHDLVTGDIVRIGETELRLDMSNSEHE